MKKIAVIGLAAILSGCVAKQAEIKEPTNYIEPLCTEEGLVVTFGTKTNFTYTGKDCNYNVKDQEVEYLFVDEGCSNRVNYTIIESKTFGESGIVYRGNTPNPESLDKKIADFRAEAGLDRLMHECDKKYGKL